MAPRTALALSSLVTVSLLGTVAQAASQCYYPNGTVNPFSEPCNTSAQNSACCGSTDVCLSNGYCLQQSGSWGNRIARGACTAKQWDDVSCPAFCTDNNVYPSQALLLVADTIGGAFCCSAGLGDIAYNSTTSQCLVGTQGSNAPFVLPYGSVIYDRSTGATLSGTLNASVLANSTAAHTQTITAKASAGAGGAKSSDTTAVAVGIAVPLAVLLMAALAATAVLWSKLRRAQKQLRDQTSSPPPSFGDATYGLKQPLMDTYQSNMPLPSDFPPAAIQSPVPPYPYQSPVHEVANTQANELPADQEPKEVANTRL